MKPRPIRMPDSLWNDLEAEAEDRGLGTAEYVRTLLRNREEYTLPDTQEETLRKRLNELEQKVAELYTEEEQPDEYTALTIVEFVDEYDIPGRAHATKDAREEIAVEYLTWLQDVHEASRHDVMTTYATDGVLARAEYTDAESFWEHFGRDLLQAAAEVDLVEVDGRTYRWVGN